MKCFCCQGSLILSKPPPPGHTFTKGVRTLGLVNLASDHQFSALGSPVVEM